MILQMSARCLRVLVSRGKIEVEEKYNHFKIGAYWGNSKLKFRAGEGEKVDIIRRPKKTTNL